MTTERDILQEIKDNLMPDLPAAPDFDRAYNIVCARIDELDKSETIGDLPKKLTSFEEFISICVEKQNAGIVLPDTDQEVYGIIESLYKTMSAADQKLFAEFSALTTIGALKLAQHGAQEYIDETNEALAGFEPIEPA